MSTFLTALFKITELGSRGQPAVQNRRIFSEMLQKRIQNTSCLTCGF